MPNDPSQQSSLSKQTVFQSVQEATEFLEANLNFETTSPTKNDPHIKLKTITQLLQLLKNPQNNYPIIHIGGTKGKGSTAIFLENLLLSAGYKVGLYSSPHILSVLERFRIDGQNCPPPRFCALASQLADLLSTDRLGRTLKPTYFELTTALALLYFSQEKCDYVILEVGLGGRLDTTNICNPVLSIITSLSLDHTHFLGETIEEIAYEKGGIIKEKTPVLLSKQPSAAQKVLSKIAHDKGAPLYQLGTDFHIHPATKANTPGKTDFKTKGSTFDYTHSIDSLTPIRMEGLAPSLCGKHQQENAALALTAALLLHPENPLSEKRLRNGVGTAHLAGRFEVTQTSPPIVLDVAHNEASIERLCQTLKEEFPSHLPLFLFATSQDKAAEPMLRHLLDHANYLFITEYDTVARNYPVSDLLALVRNIAPDNWREIPTPLSASLDLGTQNLLEDNTSPHLFTSFSKPKVAIEQAYLLLDHLQEAGKTPLLCVTGSFFFIEQWHRYHAPQE
ncbi:MAG: bifunctional folylpolyglutamate synthase/dihydrofolate synthase [Pirellulaceae bacterium]|nr:bifunctional folylpolyglutamate synthase/dihydrofolate synthase [Pirellulaceae bacterium]